MKTIILAGGGHAHLTILEKLSESPVPDTKWILISSDVYQYYSGMFSGFIEGLYTLEEIRIDLRKLAFKANCEFYEASVEKVDADNKTLIAGHNHLSFDLLSFDIGSHTANPEIKGLAEYQTALKPAHLFPQFIQTLQDSKNVAIIGGGAAACEIALSLAAWKKEQHRKCDRISLVHSGELLEAHGPKARRLITERLNRSHIARYPNERAALIKKETIYTNNHTEIPFKQLIYLGGANAPEIFRKSGLTVNEDGFLSVNTMLQSIDAPFIFGAGDCASLTAYPDLEKNGVHAVRQGPILWHNLLAALNRQPLKDYHPQNASLAILSTGSKKGLWLHGNKAFYGTMVWHIKNNIDRRFIRRFKT
ncbi:FAD-dependent oxidoreductase [Jeotgalibacillus sp. S-D1]|uniref:FAD-dependent oxidoreductase n=1 Tax=Jeotgalibacillus sp. S-D1 TaxID=2552189 RepID=UPI0014049DF3|nr:FAD-dependent oxidoreductase [Jeotgalibacillus sp. S-D1]